MQTFNENNYSGKIPKLLLLGRITFIATNHITQKSWVMQAECLI